MASRVDQNGGPQWRVWLIVAAVLIGATTCGLLPRWMASVHPPLALMDPAREKSPNDAGLAVAPASLDFGLAWEDSSFHWPLPVENRTGEDVEITQFVPSCSCTSVQPDSLLIPAGQTRETTLTLDLTEEKLGSHDLTRDFEVRISPRLRERENVSLGAWVI